MIVGIVDTGFDFYHPALAKNLGPGYFAAGVFHIPTADMTGHGTAVTSVILGRNAGEGGMVGFAPDCRGLAASLGMPEHGLIKIRRAFFAEHPDATMKAFQDHLAKRMDALRRFESEWLDYITRCSAEGIRYLVDHGARVINFSAYLDQAILDRHPEGARLLAEAFDHARDRDVLIVIGAGNSGREVHRYPGTRETVLVVGAVNLDDDLWKTTVTHQGLSIEQGSCTGPRVSVVAPMEKILAARPHDEAFYRVKASPMGPCESEYNGAYEVMPEGATSMATAVVSALAALVRSLRPDLTVPRVIAVIEAGARDLGEPGRDDRFGAGRVDFRATLELAPDLGGGPGLGGLPLEDRLEASRGDLAALHSPPQAEPRPWISSSRIRAVPPRAWMPSPPVSAGITASGM